MCYIMKYSILYYADNMQTPILIASVFEAISYGSVPQLPMKDFTDTCGTSYRLQLGLLSYRIWHVIG